MTYSGTMFDVATSDGLREAFTIKKNTVFELARYPLNHVSYQAAKFEVAMSNGLGIDTFKSNVTDGRQTDFGKKLIYPFF